MSKDMYNPLTESAKVDAFLREQNPQYDAACKRADQFVKDYLDPLFGFFDGLDQEALDMKVSSRFRTDKTPNFDTALTSGLFNPSFKSLTEAEYKRASIRAAIFQLRSLATSLNGAVRDIVMDIETTKMEE